MLLAQVEGSIVATKKNEKMTGSKFLLVRPLYVDTPAAKELKKASSTLVAVDQLGAGQGELVLIVQGSSARNGVKDKEQPVDAVVVGIVDTIDIARSVIYKAH